MYICYVYCLLLLSYSYIFSVLSLSKILFKKIKLEEIFWICIDNMLLFTRRYALYGVSKVAKVCIYINNIFILKVFKCMNCQLYRNLCFFLFLIFSQKCRKHILKWTNFPDSVVSFYQLNNFLFLFSSPRHVHFKLQNPRYSL